MPIARNCPNKLVALAQLTHSACTQRCLPRFDIIVVMCDKQNDVADTRLAEHVVGLHHKSHPDYVS